MQARQIVKSGIGQPSHSDRNPPGLLSRSRIACRQVHQKSEIVQRFRDSIKKRPSDSDWLIKYGQLGRALGLTYGEAFSAVKDHVRKLRGNIRLKWVNAGLKRGYDQTGLLG